MDDPLSRGSSFSPSESFELTALQYACKKGVLEEVKYLIDSGAELDTGPDPALHLALRKGYSSIALTLLQAGAEYEVRDSVSEIVAFKSWLWFYFYSKPDLFHKICL